MREFTKYKNDIWTTLHTLNHILNKKKSKSEFPPYFIANDKRISGFNRGLIQWILHSNQTNTCRSNWYWEQASAGFLLTESDPMFISIQLYYPNRCWKKNISNLKPKARAGSDNISSLLLKHIGDSVCVCALRIIVNQPSWTRKFPDKLKIAQVLQVYKKQNEKYLGITGPYLDYLLCQKYLKE